jgi:pyrimidine-specific ribonucleoside hydrolase
MNMKQQPTPVWIDCDPGIDDAFAIMLAAYSPKITLVGMTTSFGNTTLEKSTINALRVLNAIGLIKSDAIDPPNTATLFNNKEFGLEIPVLKGAPKPLQKHMTIAENVHGSTGLGDYSHDLKFLPQSAIDYVNKLSDGSLFHFTTLWYDFLKRSETKITILAIGPLTNLSQLLINYPDSIDYIDRIICVAGSVESGNVTPSAEFNIYSDPHAADIFFSYGSPALPIYMLPLEVSANFKLTSRRLRQINSLSSDFSKFLYDLAECLKTLISILNNDKDYTCNPIDPVGVFCLIKPSAFKYKLVNVKVEIANNSSLGKTVIKIGDSSDQEQNVYLATGCKNIDHFWPRFFNAIKIADNASPLNIRSIE